MEFKGEGMTVRDLLRAGVFVFTALALSTSSVYASKFTNQFTEFELPPGWQCALEGAEWVCQNTNVEKKRDAIIVLAAKLKGDQDSLDQYLAYLKGAKAYTSVQGKPVKSEPRYAKTVNLNGQAWIDSLHLESEIPGFYTRYLATVKQDIGVLITYSINQAKYQQYLDVFENMVKTLKVFRQPGGINVAPNNNIFNQIPTHVASDTIFPQQNIQGGADSKRPVSKQKIPLPLVLVLAGAVGYIIWRRRQKS